MVGISSAYDPHLRVAQFAAWAEADVGARACERLVSILLHAHWTRLDGTPAGAPLFPCVSRVRMSDAAARLDTTAMRVTRLALDPAKGHVTCASIEEAAVGLAAELAQLVPGPLIRDPSGQAEFIDAGGTFWDVKTPRSPPSGAKWKFDPLHQLERVRHDFSQRNRVFLNLSRCTKSDALRVIELLRRSLSGAELKRVLVLGP